MKLVVFLSVIVGVLAEPPRFRPARFRSQRIELAPTTTESPAEPTTDNAPYPAAGWKPAGEPFTLPNEKTEPSGIYGAPQQTGPYPPAGWKPEGEPFTLPQQQVPPATSYGVPDNTYGAPTTDVAPTSTDNPQVQKLEAPVEVFKSTGEYYVLLPDGRLQRVEFATENDVQNMKYTTQLQLKNPAPFFVLGR